MRLEVAGNIDDNGKLQIFQRADLQKWVSDHPGKSIILTIKVKGKRRSNPQNAYYWGVVVKMITERINELGNEFTEEDTHELLKARFNAQQIELIDGHYIDAPMSTTGMDTMAFMDYLTKIHEFAFDMLGVYVPEPNEQAEIDFNITK